MKIIRSRIAATLVSVGVIGLGAMFVALPGHAQQAKSASRYVSPAGYITGVVQGEKGPEAGVWVIAETKDLQTNLIKIVVTNNQGRFMLPELPGANYKVWVRGYGLADSTPIEMKPASAPVTLKVANAKTPQEAAKVYPGDYWLAMMEPPAKNLFPGTGPQGNGIGLGMTDQDHWINSLKSGCNFCHQLGNALTRDVTHVWAAKPELKTHTEAWEWRLGVGVRGTNMYSLLGQMGKEPTLHSLSDWTERIAKGEVPPAPARPSGVERNIVATLWDVGDDHSFMHDQISTDKNHPNVNAGGPNYAVNAGHGQLVILDQADNNTYSLDIPTREAKDKVPSRFPSPNRPSMFWGNEHLWSNPPYNPADPHNPMIDSKGRVWMTSKIRSNTDPSWCNDPSNKYADWFPLKNSARQASFYDPKTKQFTLIDTCYSTHHLQFDNDPDETVYFNELSGPIVGWVDSKVYDQTPGTPEEKEQKAVGWCGQVLDTNGDGKITRPFQVMTQGRAGDASILYATDTAGGPAPAGGRGRAGTAAAFDPTKDTLVNYSLYAMIPSPVDDSVWGVSESPFPGMLVRMQRGNNPPESCKTQIFKVPAPGYDPRGVDIDTNGVVWTGLAATSHLASFDVRKCKDLNGPAKTDGSQCKEGWTLYQTQGPKFKGTDIPSDFHYYNWVDQHNIIGLGANTPFATGSNSDSLIALDPKTQKWTYFRIPYPLGFYARGMDGRIDDANAGWKGRALYSNYGTHFVWHIEGGKGTKGKIVKFQIRPNRWPDSESMRYFATLICLTSSFAAIALAQTGGAQGTTARIKVHGKSLEGNLEGDSPDRDVSIYLPPSYKTAANRRYPVVYFLHGYTDSDDRWFGLIKSFVNLPAGIDKSLAAGAREMIVVMPNAYTRYAGSMYSSSVVTGDWEAYIAKDLVAYIDSHYRTIPNVASRGLAGHSMGGYGTMRIGMKYPEIFSSIYALSPCCMIPNMTPAPGPSKAEAIHTIEDFNKADFGTKAQFASAAVWSPNPKNPPFFFDLPTKDGQVQELVLAKWAANAPLAMVDQYLGNLKRLHAIAFDAGDKDTAIAATIGTLDGILNGYDLPHTFEIYEGTHVSGIQNRIETKTMAFFSKNLSFEHDKH